MTRENGTISVMPHERVGSRETVFPHRAEPGSNDLVGYEGDDPGVLIEAPAGSIAVFSSTSLHRSDANTTTRLRRAYLTQYSTGALEVIQRRTLGTGGAVRGGRQVRLRCRDRPKHCRHARLGPRGVSKN